jgi:amino-acid N-acetyltransferase
MESKLEIKIGKPTPSELERVKALLVAHHLTLEGFTDQLDNLLVAYKDDHIVGTAELEIYSVDALLRSVAVANEYSHKGIGTQLVSKATAYAERAGVENLNLLTETAQEYYPRFGFEIVARDKATSAIKQSAEFSGACDDSATMMQLKIKKVIR